MPIRQSGPNRQRILSVKPQAPSSGEVLTYFKDDGKLYKQDAAGIETEIAGSSTSTGADSTVPVQAEPPANATEGDLWYDSDEEQMYTRVLLLEPGAPVPPDTPPYTIILEKV